MGRNLDSMLPGILTMFIMSLLVGALFLVNHYINNVPLEEQTLKPMPDNCPNFNSEQFFNTGGSSRPETIDEVNYEMSRLRWLCSGGKLE